MNSHPEHPTYLKDVNCTNGIYIGSYEYDAIASHGRVLLDVFVCFVIETVCNSNHKLNNKKSKTRIIAKVYTEFFFY